MQTKLIKIDADDPNKEDMREAAEIIRSGGLVAFPTPKRFTDSGQMRLIRRRPNGSMRQRDGLQTIR